MINENDEGIASVVDTDLNSARQKSKHGTSGKLTMFIRSREISLRQESKREETNDTTKTQVEHRFKTPGTSSKMSFGFFRNIKKYLQIKNFCRSKRKNKEVEVVSSAHGTNHNAIISIVDTGAGLHESYQEREQQLTSQQAISSNSQSLYENRLSSMLKNSWHSNTEGDVAYLSAQCSSTDTNLSTVPTRQQEKLTRDITTISDAIIMQPSCSNTTVEVPSAIANISCDASEVLINESKVKASLAEELLNLSKYGWYWGPISVDQADAKLISEPDGAFLVRDSSDDRYVLTLSFKSSGKMLHARMEHSGGLFSLCNQRENGGFTSVAALINHSMNFSQSAVFCYSRPRYPGYPSFPVRLTKPVSRFTQVKSLQYLCRFVIRQNTSLDNIHKLPLPETIKLYILEAHY